MLAWLLTPSETHGLGATFLRRFLSRLLIENEEVDVSMTPAKVELMRLEDVEVRREWQNIDILVHSPSGGWSLLIENKIKSKESSRQLRKYKESIEREFPGGEIIPVYLTLEGEDPSEEGKEDGYISLSHARILDLAEGIAEQHRSRIPADAGILVDHYLATLRRLTMKDRELVDLCKAIYRKHREAIDLIVKYGASSQVLEAVEATAKELVGPERLTRTPNSVWFLPKEMAQFETEMSAGWDFLPTRFPVMWWFHYHKKSGKLQLVMEVGPVADPALRKDLLTAMKEVGFSFWEKGAFRDTAKFTRVISMIHKLRLTDDGEPDDSPEYIMKIAEELWVKGWAEGKKVVEVLKKCKPASR